MQWKAAERTERPALQAPVGFYICIYIYAYRGLLRFIRPEKKAVVYRLGVHWGLSFLVWGLGLMWFRISGLGLRFRVSHL